MVLFCQMDVTGRTESDPAAETLARNILDYVSGWKPAAEPAGPLRRRSGRQEPPGEGRRVRRLVRGRQALARPGPDRRARRRARSWPPTRRPSPSGSRRAATCWPSDSTRRTSTPLPPKVDDEEGRAHRRLLRAVRRGLAAGGRRAGRRPQPRPAGAAAGDRRGRRSSATACWPRPTTANVVFCQLVPWQFDYSKEQHNLKRTFRRASFLLTRLLGNMGVEGATPVLARFSSPVDAAKAGEALAGRPVPRPARRMGRPVPVLPLVMPRQH